MRRAVAWGVIALAVVAGLVEFEHAGEPGSADASGVSLNGLVDVSRGSVANDWSTAGSHARVTADGAGFVIRSTSTDIDLISRSVPVFAHTCYDLDLRAAQRSGTSAIRLRDELGRHVLRSFALGRGPALRAYRLPFGTGGHDRLAVTVEGGDGAVLQLSDVRIVRASSHRCRAIG